MGLIAAGRGPAEVWIIVWAGGGSCTEVREQAVEASSAILSALRETCLVAKRSTGGLWRNLAGVVMIPGHSTSGWSWISPLNCGGMSPNVPLYYGLRESRRVRLPFRMAPGHAPIGLVLLAMPIKTITQLAQLIVLYFELGLLKNDWPWMPDMLDMQLSLK